MGCVHKMEYHADLAGQQGCTSQIQEEGGKKVAEEYIPSRTVFKVLKTGNSEYIFRVVSMRGTSARTCFGTVST